MLLLHPLLRGCPSFGMSFIRGFHSMEGQAWPMLYVEDDDMALC